MAFETSLQDDERIILDESFQSGRMHPVAFRVTTKALYLPAQKRFALVDDWYFRRVPLSDVQSVELRRSSTTSTWITALVLIALGISLSRLMPQTQWKSPDGTRTEFYPSSIAIFGVMILFAGLGRTELIVALSDGPYRWRAPSSPWPRGKRAALEFQRRVLGACRTAGVPVVSDEATA